MSVSNPQSLPDHTNELDEILGDLFVATHGGKTASDLGRDNVDSIDYSQAKAQIQKLIDKVVNDVIGEDEQRADKTLPDELGKLDWQAKNELRTQQRNKYRGLR